MQHCWSDFAFGFDGLGAVLTERNVRHSGWRLLVNTLRAVACLVACPTCSIIPDVCVRGSAPVQSSSA